jgi:hypothetical protein
VEPNQDRREEVEHAYQGQTWKLPRRLAQLQVALAQADIACRRDNADPDELTAARARRLELVLEKYRIARPWWNTFEKYERWHADWALQDYGHAHAGPPPDSAQPPLDQTAAAN